MQYKYEVIHRKQIKRKTTRKHLNTQKKMSHTKIKIFRKEFKLEPILKATEKRKKAKYIIRNNISKFKIKCKANKIKSIVNNDLENDD